MKLYRNDNTNQLQSMAQEVDKSMKVQDNYLVIFFRIFILSIFIHLIEF